MILATSSFVWEKEKAQKNTKNDVNNCCFFIFWEASIRGLRSPLNSWDKSDSGYVTENDEGGFGTEFYKIGNNDLDLMEKLIAAGSDHSKFMRMINEKR